MSLEKILKFTTGAERELILGFVLAPTLEFSEVFMPMANTCICRLTLPLDLITYDLLDLAFMNDYFGFK